MINFNKKKDKKHEFQSEDDRDKEYTCRRGGGKCKKVDKIEKGDTDEMKK